MTSPTGREFVDRLALERVDRDIFTGWCHAAAPLRAFGGQVAAQALVAAGTTVDDPNRAVHSLHGYFLRPGRTTSPIVYLVDRPRDGRAFTTRRVRAVQNGDTIFTMSASFALPEPGPEHQNPAPLVPGPDECEVVELAWLDRALAAEGTGDGSLLDIRIIDDESLAQQTAGRFDGGLWVRTRDALPPDPLTHVCTLAYVSDLRLAGAALRRHGGSAGNPDVAVTSLDHAMWFHSPVRADEWLLFVYGSPVAGGGHGLNLGQFFTADGMIVASAVQESLMRRMPASTDSTTAGAE